MDDQGQELENEPERGKRCSVCFDLRLEKTALYAHELGFKVFATTNGIGRWKDMDQVNASGQRAAARILDWISWPGIGGIGNALAESTRITKEEGFYRQKYCGCIYSIQRSFPNKKALFP